MSEPLPENFRSAFCGFDMTDEEVGIGPFRPIAIELKHLFESLLVDADEKNEELFLTPELEAALVRFFKQPQSFYIGSLLALSPSLIDPVREIAMLVSPSLLDKLPVII